MSERRHASFATAGMALYAAVAAGCAVGPDFVRPEPPAVQQYERDAPALRAGAAPAERWWRAFGSTALDESVQSALADSPTLAAARATLAAAVESTSAARGALYPQLDAGASATRGSANAARIGTTGITTLYSLGPSASYALDLFGGTRRRIEQQQALADFQHHEVAATYLTLTGAVVAGAFNVAGAQAEISAVQELIAIDEQNLRLVQQSAAAGKATGTDVLAAEGQLANDRALLPPLRQQLDVARHAVAVLVGRAPAEWAAPDFRIEAFVLPAEVPLTMPSELVHARPDILAAESQLRAASAAVGVATAQLYPSLALTGAWSANAAGTAELFDPAGRIWSVAAGLAAPLFHGGALRAQRRAAVQAFQASLASYRATVLQAFGQVADALSALAHDAEAVAAQQAALEASRASLELTQQSYQAGQSSFIDLLDAERRYQQARVGSARAATARLQDTAGLFLALGGDALRAVEAPGP